MSKHYGVSVLYHFICTCVGFSSQKHSIMEALAVGMHLVSLSAVLLRNESFNPFKDVFLSLELVLGSHFSIAFTWDHRLYAAPPQLNVAGI